MRTLEVLEVRQHVTREIRVAMIRLGITQGQLFDALGWAKSTYSPKMQGHMPFTIDELVLLCDQLGIELAELLPGPEQEPVTA